MVQKLPAFQTLTAKVETVTPKLNALNVELVQMEGEIEKLLHPDRGQPGFNILVCSLFCARKASFE